MDENKDEPTSFWPSQKQAKGGEDVDALLEKIKRLEADKTFYEDALEARTNQLEDMERRCEDLEV